MPNIISNAEEHKDLVTEATQEKHVVCLISMQLNRTGDLDVSTFLCPCDETRDLNF